MTVTTVAAAAVVGSSMPILAYAACLGLKVKG